MRVWVLILSVLFLFPALSAYAQTPLQEGSALIDWEKSQNADERLTAFGDDLFGDGIDPHTGSLSFSHTDVSIPGNSSLAVKVSRSRSPGQLFDEDEDVEFGDWGLNVPKVYAIAPASQAWVGNRCSDGFSTQFPPFSRNSAILFGNEYSTGVTLDGDGSGQLLENPYGDQWPVTATHVTKSNWYFKCTSASDGGQGFIGYAPNGSIYKFDKVVIREAKSLGLISSSPLKRYKYQLFASEVTDAHGNWVKYTYTVFGNLTRIHSNDGRDIAIAYAVAGKPNLISSVSTNGRVWTYAYEDSKFLMPDWLVHTPRLRRGKALKSVTLPDGRTWEYDLHDMTAEGAPSINCQRKRSTLTITHPSGAVGEFKLRDLDHRHIFADQLQRGIDCPSAEPPSPGGPTQPIYQLKDNVATPVMSVTQKKISGADIPAALWTYTYEQDTSSGTSSNDRTNWTKVSGPGVHITYVHTWNSEPFGGSLISREIRETEQGAVLSKTEYDYTQEAALGSSFMATNYSAGNLLKPVRTVETKTHNGSDWFLSESTFDTDHFSSTYSWGNPLTTSVSSNVSPTPRATINSYEHNTTHWILGLPKTVTQSGRLMVENTYSPEGEKIAVDQYGVRVAEYSYSSDGTVNRFTDAIGRVTRPLNWKRGTPQRIIRPDNFSMYQYVDDNGWLTSSKNTRSHTTNYTRDNMGRLTQYIPPQTLRQWDPTNVSYSFNPNATQTITKANGQTTITYDSMNRPVLVAVTDLTDQSTTYTRTEYDAAGRTIFESYPSTSPNPTEGMVTTYDGLGRVVSTYPTSDPSAKITYQYLDNNRRRVIDEDGNVTTYSYRGYNGPHDGPVSLIEQPQDVKTYMTYDIWDQLTRVRQLGTQNGIDMNESMYFSYDAQGRRCRKYTQEGRQTNYKYDAAGQLIAYSKGQPPNRFCTEPYGLSRVDMTYDDLGRVTKTDYEDPGTPDIEYSYYRNGLPLTTKRGGVISNYRFDELDQPIWEQMFVDGRAYRITYGYNDAGHLTSRKMPGGQVLEYDVDGLGRMKSISHDGDFLASGASYHPSGALDAFTYGNGYVFGQTLDARQRPIRLQVAGQTELALDQSLTYTNRGRVNSVTDLADIDGLGNDRSYVYDALGRLTQAFGPWGQSDYSYDALGNLRSKTQLSSTLNRTVTNSYDWRNRIIKSEDSLLGTRLVNHDTRGNVTRLGGQYFVYDQSNQPIQLSGDVSGSYLYDGNMKRVRVTMNGETHYNFYDRSGKLVHVDNRAGADKRTNYVYAGDQMIARLETIGNNVAPPIAYYQFTDMLGSPVAGTDATGAVSWRERYTPFGEKMLKPAQLDNQASFTGHIDDTATGLTYMQARYYDPNIGRFLSIDPVEFEPDMPMQFNRYAYTWNDPVNANDPDGEFLNFVAKFVVDVALEVAIQAATGQDIDLGAAGKSAALGLIDPTKTARKAARLGEALNDGRKARAAARTCCFVAGTLVDTENGLRPIEDIKIGDLVFSKDEETGVTAYKPVLGLIRLHDRVIWDLETVSETGDGHTFRTTDDHPWWVEGHGWKRTDELAAADVLASQSGKKISVVSVTNTNLIEPTFNFEVAEFNTYFVGESKVWVHNAACDVGSAGGSRAGKKHTRAAVRDEIAANAKANGGTTKCVTCKVDTTPTTRRTMGSTVAPTEGQGAHIKARANGGNGATVGDRSNIAIQCASCNNKTRTGDVEFN